MSEPAKIPVRERFPNRYTGGYTSSAVTEKIKYATLATIHYSPKKPNPLNSNSNMSGSTVIAKKAFSG